MPEITVTLEDGADDQFIRRIIENVKGVLSTTSSNHNSHTDIKTEEWIRNMKKLSNSINPSSIVDWDDDKTKYLMR